MSADEREPAPAWTANAGPRIGTDEAGKGDYFGYLVVGAVYVEPSQEASLRELGVRDSKRMSDQVARRLAGEIVARVPSEIVRISPRRYNEFYTKLRNLNHLLAWAHARAIENLLARAPAPLVVSDQFGDEQRLRQALMRKGRRVTLVQAPHAEREVAVAAASVVARAAFLETLEALSARVGVALPKGATHVIATAREIRRRGGDELLAEVAKLHFRVTQQARQGDS
ncbi:MAG TPA: ribonuclease HIII [Armatimonadota bacterium]|nr:ribonuclease HIII [Armatimonadota bacterium]